jgi:endonuclease-3
VKRTGAIGDSQGNILSEELLALDKLLKSAYGPKSNHREEDPVTSLVHTILSQNTTDRTSDRAFEMLVGRFGGWEAVLASDTSEIVDSIRIGGLAEQKAASIKGVLQRIKGDFGSISLESLKKLPDEDAMDYLVSLKGVGPKTAACTMLFALGMKAFPVDTHIHRVVNRLGMITTKSAEQSQKALTAAAPFDICYSLHLNIIQHGRQRCHARKPLCAGCLAQGICKSAEVI